MKTAHEKVSHKAHPGSMRAYFINYLALLGLLVLTIVVAWVNLGAANLLVALFIASIKAGLVLWFFMHLPQSPRLVAVFMGAAVAMLIVSAVLTLTDYVTRS